MQHLPHPLQWRVVSPLWSCEYAAVSTWANSPPVPADVAKVRQAVLTASRSRLTSVPPCAGRRRRFPLPRTCFHYTRLDTDTSQTTDILVATTAKSRSVVAYPLLPRPMRPPTATPNSSRRMLPASSRRPHCFRLLMLHPTRPPSINRRPNRHQNKLPRHSLAYSRTSSSRLAKPVRSSASPPPLTSRPLSTKYRRRISTRTVPWTATSGSPGLA